MGWPSSAPERSEEHTSELQSRQYLVCRLLLEKKNRQLVYVSSSSLEACDTVPVVVPFFFNDTATTEIYTLSLHDALPICAAVSRCAASVHSIRCTPIVNEDVG